MVPYFSSLNVKCLSDFCAGINYWLWNSLRASACKNLSNTTAHHMHDTLKIVIRLLFLQILSQISGSIVKLLKIKRFASCPEVGNINLEGGLFRFVTVALLISAPLRYYCKIAIGIRIKHLLWKHHDYRAVMLHYR